LFRLFGFVHADRPSNAPSPETVQYLDLMMWCLSDPNSIFLPDGACLNSRVGPESERRCQKSSRAANMETEKRTA
jgi:hypothetical protein